MSNFMLISHLRNLSGCPISLYNKPGEEKTKLIFFSWFSISAVQVSTFLSNAIAVSSNICSMFPSFNSSAGFFTPNSSSVTS